METSTVTADLTPRVWIGSLRMYAEGHLVGHWFDAIDADEVTEADAFRGSGFRPNGDEELWCLDTENMPINREMSPREAAAWARSLTSVDEHLRPALVAWVQSGDYTAEGAGELPVISDFVERYCGTWEDFESYAQDLADNIGLLDAAPEELARYFHWKSWISDLAMEYSTVDAPNGGMYVFRSL